MKCENKFEPKSKTYLELSSSLQNGTPFSVFLLTVQAFFCLLFFLTIPIIRKDSAFLFICLIFSPFIIITLSNGAITLFIYFNPEAYINLNAPLSLISCKCSKLFFFVYHLGFLVYSLFCCVVVLIRKHISKAIERVSYFAVFLISITPIFLNKIVAYDYYVSFNLVGFNLLDMICSIILIVQKNNFYSDINMKINNEKNKIICNIPLHCINIILLSTVTFPHASSSFLPLSVDDFYIFRDFYFPLFSIIQICFCLSIMRKAIFSCFYSSNREIEPDKLTLISQNSSIRTLSSSDNSSIGTNSISSMPSNITGFRPNSISPLFHMYPVNNDNISNQPIFMIAPIPFFQSQQTTERENNTLMPTVQ